MLLMAGSPPHMDEDETDMVAGLSKNQQSKKVLDQEERTSRSHETKRPAMSSETHCFLPSKIEDSQEQ